MAKTAIQEMIMVLMGLLVIGMTTASAQTASLGPGEISCTTADSLSDIWFRHTYLTQRRPSRPTTVITPSPSISTSAATCVPTPTRWPSSITRLVPTTTR